MLKGLQQGYSDLETMKMQKRFTARVLWQGNDKNVIKKKVYSKNILTGKW